MEYYSYLNSFFFAMKLFSESILFTKVTNLSYFSLSSRPYLLSSDLSWSAYLLSIGYIFLSQRFNKFKKIYSNMFIVIFLLIHLFDINLSMNKQCVQRFSFMLCYINCVNFDKISDKKHAYILTLCSD